MCDWYEPINDPNLEFDPEESVLYRYSTQYEPYGSTYAARGDYDDEYLSTLEEVISAGFKSMAVPEYYDKNGDFLTPDDIEGRKARWEELHN